MQKTKKQNQKKYFSQTALLGILSLVIFFSVGIFAGNVAEGDTQDKLNELNARAAVYRQIIDIKKKQSETLGNKISSMDSNLQMMDYISLYQTCDLKQEKVTLDENYGSGIMNVY